MTSDIQKGRLPVDGFGPKCDRNLQMMCKDNIPNVSPVSLTVFELSCSQTDMIPKLCFSDSGRSKTWRSVKMSSSNFLTITILSLCTLRIRESKNGFQQQQQQPGPAFGRSDQLLQIGPRERVQ
ncbi:hypothetical protein AVEN_73410-1 [Araneus ventricosus]|uniref:Uncharacterized protein n=1 Tax=Araneus ventricosus TaxID=182803 RepID=A0A4Y2UN34_ARAVE|nr:hypothetical protein AVEN_73410-1 [Araneus ventricosus]